MGQLNNLTHLWNMVKGLKTREAYIPVELDNPCKISCNQKSSAKKAILWLLSKAPHSPEEIADHYEMSPQLVARLLEELADAKLINKETIRSTRYVANESIRKVGEVS